MTRFQIILPLAAAAIAAATANAQSYAITRSLVGTTAQFTSTPGSYALRSNAGQSAATAPRVNVSANYTNGLGFWASARTPTPGCIADVDDGSFTGTRDGGVTIDDLLLLPLHLRSGSSRRGRGRRLVHRHARRRSHDRRPAFLPLPL